MALHIDNPKQIKIETERAITIGIGNADEAWKAGAIECVRKVCLTHRVFTANEVRNHLDSTSFHTHDKRAMGGVMRVAKKNGWIIPTGQSIRSRVGHGTSLQIWKSLIFENHETLC